MQINQHSSFEEAHILQPDQLLQPFDRFMLAAPKQVLPKIVGSQSSVPLKMFIDTNQYHSRCQKGYVLTMDTYSDRDSVNQRTFKALLFLLVFKLKW